MRKVVVLTSGGIDSSILLWDLSQQAEVFPIYIQNGLVWEETELWFLSRFIHSISNPNVHSLTTLTVGAGGFMEIIGVLVVWAYRVQGV